MGNLDTINTTQQTYIVPAPNGQQIIANRELANVQTVVSSNLDNPGTTPQAPTHAADTYTISGRPDVWTQNQRVTQVFPVNAPPANS